MKVVTLVGKIKGNYLTIGSKETKQTVRVRSICVGCYKIVKKLFVNLKILNCIFC